MWILVQFPILWMNIISLSTLYLLYSLSSLLQLQGGQMRCLVFLLLDSFCSLSFFVTSFLSSQLPWLQFSWFVSSCNFWPVSFKCFVESLVWMCSSTVSSWLRCKVFIGSTSGRSSRSLFEDSCQFSDVIRISSTRLSDYLFLFRLRIWIFNFLRLINITRLKLITCHLCLTSWSFIIEMRI